MEYSQQTEQQQSQPQQEQPQQRQGQPRRQYRHRQQRYDQPQVADNGLYRFANEHDACGVGMVADINNVPSHKIVQMGLTVLKRLMHRGAAGGDPETGDGAGLLLSMPDAFFRKVFEELPPQGKYGVGMLFGGEGFEDVINDIVKNSGGSVILWREVPVDLECIGRAARESCPLIRQIFVDGSAFESQAEFERKLFVMRRLMEKAVNNLYVCSLSSRSIVYKGLLLATQLERFYSDLCDEDFRSPLALVHQRYSTNTFPTWSLAHPYRYLAHNGEINTLRGNLNSLRGREPCLESPLFGDDIKTLLPLIAPGQSDSASLDNMFELLVAAGRDLAHSMLMLVPQAWGAKYHLGRDVRGFFEYHSALMEPWDGPAALCASDGVNACAILDRNGLRPARYTLCKDGLFVLASEAGVLDIAPADVLKKGCLHPGEILCLDLENRRLVHDNEIKSNAARRRPYRRWVEENKIAVHGLFSEITPDAVPANLPHRQRLFGYTREDLEMILQPMAKSGHEPVGSMGNDAALAVLSEKPQLLFSYFKQLFAQVTNPPIDPIREELVMSLLTYIGNEGNILAETPRHARLVKLQRPVLTDDELRRVAGIAHRDFRARALPIEFPSGGGALQLERALKRLASDAAAAVESGCNILILTDRSPSPGMIPMPSLLATAAVNRALTAIGKRPSTGIIVQSGEVREVMHFALLIGYGATAVHPYLALETVTDLALAGKIPVDATTAAGNYINAIDKGLLKIMSKMGISTLRSYRSGQVFEAVGLSPELIAAYLPGTASRIGGIGLAEIAREAAERHEAAEAFLAAQNAAPESHESPETLDVNRIPPYAPPLLPHGGEYHYRADGANHLWTPSSLSAFRIAVQTADYAKFKEYSRQIDDQAGRLCTLRGLFKFNTSASSNASDSQPAASHTSIPLDQVEPIEAIIKKFVSGAMSLGSLSPEAHETIAIAMNQLGAMSNSGEGGEDSARSAPGPNGENRASAIRQIASGRFGVTIDYLRHARDLQIKMAQGAKPGEGGQLPGHKVDAFIARVRHSMPNVTLISPPPHHDIYSIEDLAQLICDLRTANPKARVSVKLVSEVGVGTVAAGVAKAHADVALIAGHDGGTGASPLTSIKHAGLPWELGLAETQQTLILNNLRGRIKIQVDGQLKTGRDIVIAALLGAEEFGFATTLLVCLGCVMMRKCHENSCPVGVATQDPALRKRFAGKPEYIVNFLRFIAQETREHLAALGLRSLDEACGRSDLLSVNHAIDFYKTKNLDFSALLGAPTSPRPPAASPAAPAADAAPNFDRRALLPALLPAVAAGRRAELDCEIRNTDRSAGAELSGEIAEKYGEAGLPDDTLRIRLTGCAGQSFGAFLAPGVTLELTGEANDFVGKGISGGVIIARPPAIEGYRPERNVIAGNVIGYGATSGKILLNGQAGARFAVRNSGATMTAEGVGDHACEYMTGGRVLILGPTGVNFAAGMTGGLAYVYDETSDFDLRCNLESVDLDPIAPSTDDETELLALLNLHAAATGSPRARALLSDWENARPRFLKVFPVEYRQALGRMLREDAEAVDRRKPDA